MAIALIFDLIMKENPYEIAVIISIFVISPVLTLFCLSKGWLQASIRILVIALVFVVVPALFFFRRRT